jgi:enamine deaminase RidA (YjgF/YER057c/UK114 family)
LTRFGPALKAAGFDYKDIVASDVFVTDVQNSTRERRLPAFFQTDAPVGATLGIQRLAGAGALVEIMVTAVK